MIIRYNTGCSTFSWSKQCLIPLIEVSTLEHAKPAAGLRGRCTLEAPKTNLSDLSVAPFFCDGQLQIALDCLETLSVLVLPT